MPMFPDMTDEDEKALEAFLAEQAGGTSPLDFVPPTMAPAPAPSRQSPDEALADMGQALYSGDMGNIPAPWLGDQRVTDQVAEGRARAKEVKPPSFPNMDRPIRQSPFRGIPASGGDVHAMPGRGGGGGRAMGGGGGGGGTDWGLALAMIGDLLINDGRGQPYIMKTFGPQPGKDPLDQELKRARLEQMRRGTAVDPLDAAYKQAQIENLKARTGQIGQPNPAEGRLIDAENRRKQEFDINYNPGNPVAQQYTAAMNKLLTTGTLEPSDIEGLPVDALNHLSAAVAATGKLARNTAEVAADVERQKAVGDVQNQQAVSRAFGLDKVAKKREARGEKRATEAKAQAMEVDFAQSDQRIADLEQQLDDLIAQKGEDYVIPTQGGVIRQFFVKGNQAIFGGTGMDDSDTAFVSDAKAAGLGRYIQDAGNAPNALPEQATAFDSFFQTGRLGTMRDRLRNLREKGARTHARKLRALRGTNSQTAPTQSGGSFKPDDDGVDWD